MSHDHTAVGWERYEVFVRALRVAGISVQEFPESELEKAGRPILYRAFICNGCGKVEAKPQRLRVAFFKTSGGEPVTLEEKCVDTEDIDGSTAIDISVYAVIFTKPPRLENGAQVEYRIKHL